MNNDLPKDWKWMKIGEVADVNPKIPNRDEISDDLEVQFLPMKLVEELTGNIHLTETKSYGEVKKGYTPFINNDVLFAKVTPCMENGKIAVVDKLKNEIGFGSSEFHVVRSKEDLLNKYGFYYLIQQRFRNEAEHAMTGAVGLRRVPKQFIENYSLPLPPKTVQQQIVSKIEELFSEIDKGIEELRTAQQQLKVYRQAVIKWAFEGKLTNGDVVDGDLPEGWKLEKLGNLLEVLTDYHANGSYVKLKENVSLKDEKDYAVMIRATNFEKRDFTDNLKYISKEAYEFLGKSKLFGEEILIGKIGNAGRVYFMPNLYRPASLAMNLFALRVNGDCSSKYIYYHLLNTSTEREIRGHVKGVGNPTIDKKAIRSINIAFCPLPEQQQIVQEIESRLSVCDKIEETITNSLKQAEALRQSILKKAFEGKLISQ